MQSLKSYYFPDQQDYGKAIVSDKISTNFIGSSKWPGNSSKKRVTT